MVRAAITLTDKQPPIPEADFAFYVDFKKGEGSPSRVFSATYDFIQACERIDRELVASIDSSIETVMVLEDIEAGSIKTWLRNVLNSTDDQALKELNWKPAVGKYLVRAKWLILHWIDNDATPRSLPDLRKDIQKLAQETDVRHMPDYLPPPTEALLRAVKDFQGVKNDLHPNDRAVMITPQGEAEMNLTIRLNIEKIEDLAVSRTLDFPPAPMILAVKKPDYLGTSKWDFRFGKRNISAKIEDEAWLRRFQGREEDVRPGDALQCTVKITHLYGHDNELISGRYVITHVEAVLVNQYNQRLMFDGDDLPDE